MSKGSKRRPQRVPDKAFEDSWERIFGKKSEDSQKGKAKD